MKKLDCYCFVCEKCDERYDQEILQLIHNKNTPSPINMPDADQDFIKAQNKAIRFLSVVDCFKFY